MWLSLLTTETLIEKAGQGNFATASAFTHSPDSRHNPIWQNNIFSLNLTRIIVHIGKKVKNRTCCEILIHVKVSLHK